MKNFRERRTSPYSLSFTERKGVWREECAGTLLQVESSETKENSSPFLPIPPMSKPKPGIYLLSSWGWFGEEAGGAVHEDGTCSCSVGLLSILGGDSMVTAPPAAIDLPAQGGQRAGPPLFQGSSSGGGAGRRARPPCPLLG